MSTRRRESVTFDHGAQYFTARSEAFIAQVADWEAAGVIAPWVGRFAIQEAGTLRADPTRHARYVGTPKMSSVGRHLARGLDVRLGARIVALEGSSSAWSLRDASGEVHGPFEAVLISAPGPQARALLPEGSRLSAHAAAMDYAPCWAVMADYAAPALPAWDGVKLSEGPLAWVARDSAKPGRPPGERWVLHASPTWTRDHLEESPESVIDALTSAMEALGAPSPIHAQAHRWRYALAAKNGGEPARYAADERLGLMGDGLIAPRVEAAWQSGVAMADALLRA